MSDVPEGYKMSEVGVIPEEWEVKSLENIGLFKKGKNIPKKDLTSEGVPCVLYGEIYTKYNFTSKKLNSFIPHVIAQQSTSINKGDILFAGSGETAEEIGKCFTYLGDEKACAGGDINILSPFNDDSTFLGYLLNSPQVNKQKSNLGQGSSVVHIYSSSLKTILIPTPPIPEQQAIASALSDVGALITALEQLITKKRNIKQGAMQQLLTGEKRLLGFGGVWEVINIAENSVLKARIGWQGLTTAEYLKNGEYYLVTGTDFIEGKINWSGCHFIDENRYVQDKNIQLRNNDVLITKDGTIGKVGYVDNLPGKATLNSGVFVIRPRDKSYFPLFFYHVLKSNIFDTFMKQLRAGSTISHLYQKDFVNFSFSVPSPPEQQAIARILSDMDIEIEALKQKWDKYKAIKQGMMQELLTGKTRLVKEDKT